MNKEKEITIINEDLNEEIYELEEIKQKIYYIRGKQVMLDSDLANLYEVETKKLNQAVKRNKNRFPIQFCFQLKESEYESLRSQFVTLKIQGRGKHRKYLPYVFTEQGVAMLSAVLHSNKSVEISIKIISAFIEMKNFLMNNIQIYNRITGVERKIIEHDKKFDDVFKQLAPKENIKQKVFFQGQIWDSYSLIIDLIKKAKEKIVIIDNYVDDSILNMLSKKNKDVEVVILTSEKGKITKLDVQKFNKEYPVLKLAKTNKFHDRFIILDNKELYHLRCIYKRFRK